MVRRFAEIGNRVVFTYKQSKRAADALSKETGAISMKLDVTNKSADEAVKRIIREYGSVDVLINNAGISHQCLLMDTRDEDYQRVMDTNVYGTFNMMRAVLPSMVERRSGVIINISSVWGQTGGACETVYSASKAAVIGLTRATAKEVASAGIRVNCIAPGLIDTEMNSELTEESVAELIREIPLGRIGRPDDVVNAALFLSSDNASYITGEVLSVNGGWILGK